MEEFADVIVLGMGPAGEDVAGRLADAGLDVIGIEPELVGGECPYWGCVPTKMMVRAADVVAEARRARGLSGVTAGDPSWSPVAGRVADGTDDWDDDAAVRRFEQRGGRLFRGVGRLDGPKRVVVDGSSFVARRAVVVATGTKAVVPSVTGLADTPFWTNRDAVATRELPGSVVVLGGGAVGVEFAQLFRRFGSDVTVIESAPRLLTAEEPEVAGLLADVFDKEGIDVRTSAEVTSVQHDGARFTILTGDGGAVTGDRLLVAVGRVPDLDALGVVSLGLEDSPRHLDVDGAQRVIGTDGVWAVGDVTGAGAFTHMAMAEAGAAVADILGNPAQPVNLAAVPRVTFTDPEIGSVGMTEREARAAGLSVRVGSVDLAESARGWIHGPGTTGLIKVVEDADRGVLVGATSVGPCGGEVLGLLSLAVHAEVPVGRLRTLVTAYPTFHRAVAEAIGELRPA